MQDAGALQLRDEGLAKASLALHPSAFALGGEVRSRPAVKKRRMNTPTLPNDTFDMIFGYAPLILGVIIYAIFFVAKRHEAAAGGVPIGQTFACAKCGRRGVREHMVPQEHEGAVSWFCGKCAGH
jgi:hypothetical protein